MANAADSQPFFEQHARKIGMEQQLLDKFIAGGVKTVSMAAYAATQPGQPLTDREVSTLCTSLGQNNPTLAQMTVVKRLLFECQTMSLANLKATVEQQPDSVLRKLPGAERAQRLELQAQRLGGLSIEHDLEPAFSVYDAVSTQVEQGSLKYLHPSKIPTRRQELAKPPAEASAFSPQASHPGVQRSGQVQCTAPQTIQECWVLEIFAGSAGITSAAASAGLKRSVGVDNVRVPRRKGKIIQLDLLLLSHQGLLWKWLGSPGLAAVWLAPPCGTSSRAREIPSVGGRAASFAVSGVPGRASRPWPK